MTESRGTSILFQGLAEPVIGNIRLVLVRYLTLIEGTEHMVEGGIHAVNEGRALVVDGELYLRDTYMPPCFKQPADWPCDVLISVYRFVDETITSQRGD